MLFIVLRERYHLAAGLLVRSPEFERRGYQQFFALIAEADHRIWGRKVRDAQEIRVALAGIEKQGFWEFTLGTRICHQSRNGNLFVSVHYV